MIIEFKGIIRAGFGAWSEKMVVAGSESIGGRIRVWPQVLYPGTLNVEILADGFPAEFIAKIGSRSLRELESGTFIPEAELRYSEIRNNTKTPTESQEREERGPVSIKFSPLTPGRSTWPSGESRAIAQIWRGPHAQDLERKYVLTP